MLGKLSEEETYLVEGFLKAIRSPEPEEKLTFQERKFLSALRSAPGRVFTNSYLADVVANDSLEPPEPKITAVLVCKIRKKRPDLGDRIETVWGEGYVWK